MNLINAARAMRPLIDKSMLPDNGEFGKAHLVYMTLKIESGKVSGEKGQRWLGYIQGVVVHAFGATLKELKELNADS